MLTPRDPRPTEVWFPNGALLRLDVEPAVRVRDDVASTVAGWLLQLAPFAEASEALVRDLRALGLDVAVRRLPGCTTVRVTAPRSRPARPAPLGAIGAADA